jgi:hypothetical protein
MDKTIKNPEFEGLRREDTDDDRAAAGCPRRR